MEEILLLQRVQHLLYEKIIDISKNDEYTTDNLLDYDYFKKYYKLIAIDLSKQQEKKENTILEFSQNFANVLYKTKV